MNKFIHTVYIGLFFVVGILSLILLIANGYDYYQLPIEERVFSANHISLKPSGTWGHGLGILGTIMMIFGVAVYMIRKHYPRKFRFGNLKYWLEFHIFLCSVGPIFVLFHTTFKFGGIVSISFWSMVAVVLSGVIGRFIYIQIPRTIQGHELDLNELNDINRDLTVQLSVKYDFSTQIIDEIEQEFKPSKYTNLSFWSSFKIIMSDFFKLRKKLNSVKSEIKRQNITDKRKSKEIMKIVKSKIILLRRIGLLKTMQKLFNYWHIVHLPFAISMFVIMIIHVAVTIIFGYRWIF
ncbi:MAG: hypothetical protein CO129_00630 [Ignavibacteriales bacterium CG_4_9_14_3_um_filter_34_10]|nr:MAG: hypothetical protein CO129_00630 [Ignavibacteriales bacterium CG_4_9_14_3_um_filter_34_10]